MLLFEPRAVSMMQLPIHGSERVQPGYGVNLILVEFLFSCGNKACTGPVKLFVEISSPDPSACSAFCFREGLGTKRVAYISKSSVSTHKLTALIAMCKSTWQVLDTNFIMLQILREQ